MTPQMHPSVQLPFQAAIASAKATKKFDYPYQILKKDDPTKETVLKVAAFFVLSLKLTVYTILTVFQQSINTLKTDFGNTYMYIIDCRETA